MIFGKKSLLGLTDRVLNRSAAIASDQYGANSRMPGLEPGNGNDEPMAGHRDLFPNIPTQSSFQPSSANLMYAFKLIRQIS